MAQREKTAPAGRRAWARLRRIALPGWQAALPLALLAAAALAWTFTRGLEQTPFGYGSYALSAYALAACVGAAAPGIREARRRLRARPLVGRYLGDRYFRVRVGLSLSLLVNLCYAGLRLICAALYASFWDGALAVYYVCLCALRAYLLRCLPAGGGGGVRGEWRVYRTAGAGLLALSVALSGIAVQIVRDGRGYTTDEKGRGPALSNSLFENNAEFSMGMCLAVQQQRERLAGYVERLAAATADAALKAALEAWLDGADDGARTIALSEAVMAALDATAETGELVDYVRDNREHLVKKSMWMYGGDGWAYDIGYGGLDHVLASGADVNILVVDTEVYSNTGGQASKATPIGAVAQFAASGKKVGKKDLGMLAMEYGHVYVASVALGADPNQLVKALKEAETHKGPSLIVAYAPCINHGIVKGMAYAQQESKLAVDSGYWFLYRYSPARRAAGENPFILDSREPSLPLRDFLMGEVRYAALGRTFPEQAEQLMGEAEKQSREKYEKYRRLAER